MNDVHRQALYVLQQRLQYEFGDIRLLDTATTHTSYVKGDGRAKQHNERLEFLGDAVLELCVSEYVFNNYPQLDEGEMTRVRSAAVRAGALAGVAAELEVSSALLLSRGEANSGGGSRQGILADAMEAIIGAVFTDGGMDAARELVLRLIRPLIITAANRVNTKDYKTLLQEYVQKHHMGSITYDVQSETGPDHMKTFVMLASLNGETVGAGSGASKQEASQLAARAALEGLGRK